MTVSNLKKRITDHIQDPWSLGFGLVIFLFVFQLFSIQVMALNADETLYQLISEEIAKLLRGEWPALNPLVPYEGPLDFWVLGSFYAVFHDWLGVRPEPWLFRYVPLFSIAIGVLVLFRECKKSFPAQAETFWLALAVSPLILVFSRVAFPQSFMVALFFVLLAEQLRIYRTGEVRWFRIAILGGVAVEAHITALIGLAAVYAPVLPIVFRRAKIQWRRVLAAVLVFLVFAWPVLRNYPFPISATPGKHWYLELRNFLNVLSGYQSFTFMLTRDVGPIFLSVGFVLVLLAAASWYLRVLFKERRQASNQYLLASALAHGAATLFLLTMCYHGRTLTDLGTERYFLSLLPGWLFLQSDLLVRMRQRFRLQGLRGWAVVSVLFLYFFLRLSIPLAYFSDQKDPLRPAAEWLEQECPASECVAYVDGFAGYWPIRFYSDNRLALNSLWVDWKPVPVYDPAGKRQAGCWAVDAEKQYAGEFEKRRDFPAGAGRQGYHCYSGIKL